MIARNGHRQGWIGRALSWLVALALMVLWQQGAGPRPLSPAALAGLAPLTQDIGAAQAPRAIGLHKAGAEDRSPAPPPDAILPSAPGLSAPVALRRAGLTPAAAACLPARPCPQHRPRAPPVA